MFYKPEEIELSESEQLKKKISNYFLENQTSRLTINIKKVKLRIEYMYGARYTIRAKYPEGKVYTIELIAAIDKIVSIILNEKYKDNLEFKLKGLAKLKK